ncbi:MULTISPECIES: hypothetical protein [Flavobacteriaceae]|uniref:Restriction endonuclease n=2 Tax=Flavobacteriaceae TaxID=49546 RepID=A0A1D8P9M8_9FLAO|nr:MULTISPECIES: hypothetical protein [Flavobacteriaceae]AOW21235.1 hypothetical protein LPB138_11330 [Urechidicola croceus]RFN58979.1 hypothetical protein DZ858_02540 [Marixanthomonas ophiurae]|tara:strand:+ start:251 stop:922 length:672 start_codon:yes stop_codon:yes gene_type:complete
MVVDDFSEESTGASFSIDLSAEDIRDKILESISNTAKPFVHSVHTHKNTHWNEDSLTQVFIAQNTVQLQKLSSSLMVAAQYRDIYHKTKGIPDVFYSMIEEGRDHKPSFVMEAKRLPTPTSTREKEYVVGKTTTGNPNGGIERFKLGKHGAGHSHCGMLAFVEKEEYQYWLKNINSWIAELYPVWSESELLKLQKNYSHYSHFKSKAERDKGEVNLDHFWIKI